MCGLVVIICHVKHIIGCKIVRGTQIQHLTLVIFSHILRGLVELYILIYLKINSRKILVRCMKGHFTKENWEEGMAMAEY